MAAPNYRGYGDREVRSRRGGGPQVARPFLPERRKDERAPGRGPSRPGARTGERRQAALRRRRFVMLVIVPVALLLGSVYLHNVAASTQRSVTELEERISQAESSYEQLGVREARLSNSERIRSLAAEDYGMRAPEAGEIEALEVDPSGGDGFETQGTG